MITIILSVQGCFWCKNYISLTVSATECSVQVIDAKEFEEYQKKRNNRKPGERINMITVTVDFI